MLVSPVDGDRASFTFKIVAVGSGSGRTFDSHSDIDIKVEPVDGYYWDTKHAMVVGLVKRMVGAAIGKNMDDSIEGKIKLG